MSTYTLKSIAQRGLLVGVAVVTAAVAPAHVFADSLNPLTERSLLLSSSAPGFQDTDGSGNSETSLNAGGTYYAPPGSGPNGKKTGQTFTFRVSSDSAATSTPIKALTFQYCTTAAGYCQSPGNNTGDAKTPDREANADAWPNKRSDLNVAGTFNWSGLTDPAAGGFTILINGVVSPASDWTMTSENAEDTSYSGALTGKNNYITLKSATGISPAFNDKITVIFKASTSAYITNPGSSSFFVKINTYDSDTSQINPNNDPTPADTTDQTVIDGGVTVANVMTDSIHITTKVLETMAFSVGTQNPDSTASPHGTCDAINQTNGNRLQMGNPNAEYSLETARAWDVYSYWRLSSNSSGGATVYYSGNTLANTVGDEIMDMTTKSVSIPGTEQFGLAFVDANDGTLDSSFTALVGTGKYKNPTSDPFNTLTGHNFTTAAQTIGTDYRNGFDGTADNANGVFGTAEFKFLKSSSTVPEPIAQESEKVISCATAKMRYIGNIGADTPAGVYTTKINYLAAPQY